MHGARRTTTLGLTALLLCSAPATAIEKGESLASALDDLRRDGLQLIFSSALVRPELRVEVEPGDGDAEAVARRILAPHGLALRSVRPGLFSVVRADAKRDPLVPNGDPAQSGRAKTPSDDPLYEVGVYASRYVIDQRVGDASLAELSRRELEALPGLNEDVLRAARFLPGTASNPLSARTHVRGGRDDEVALFFDGVPLFEPFHYKDVQGLLGVLDPASVSRVDFFSGVFPARYGNRLSGVIDIAPRTREAEPYNAIGASALHTHAISQGRMQSRPVEWLASVRRGNLDVLARLMGREQEAEPRFMDALARVQVDLGARHTLSAGWLMLDDSLRADLEGGIEQGDLDYRDGTGWLGWQFHASERAELAASVSRTERDTRRGGTLTRAGVSSGALTDSRSFDTTTARVEGSFELTPRLTLNTGLEWYDYRAHYDYRSEISTDPAFADIFGRPTSAANVTLLDMKGEAYAAHASAAVEITPRLSIDAALRWDAQRFGAFFSDDQLSPRFSVQYRLDRATLLRMSWGRMAQTQRPDELQVSDGEEVFHPAQRSTQIAVSLERHIGPALVRVEAYNRRVSHPSPAYENLLDPFALLPELEVDRVRVDPDDARLYGIELSARWRWSNVWTGWTSYSWSEATDHFGPRSELRTWDQKHSVATGLAWTRAPWQLSANLDWHTGWRRNSIASTPAGFELASRNSDAWPFYLSLNLRASWLRPLKSGVLEVTAEIDNATNRSNPCCISYTLDPAQPGLPIPDASNWLPRVYLVGVTWQLP